MTPFDRLVLFLASLRFDPWVFVKILFLIGFSIYLAFAIIVVRQVNLMTRTLDSEFEAPLKLIAWVHLLASFGVFLLAVLIL